MLEAIVAVYADWGIGCCGTQPVVISADRKHFREVTAGAAVIVGRKTLADFPGGRPLPKRTNIVLTSSDLAVEGTVVVHSVAEALEKAGEYARCFVIGGESVYRQLFPHTDRIYVTKIDHVPHSDAFFPNLDADKNWHITEQSEQQEENGIQYRFLTYERTKAQS